MKFFVLNYSCLQNPWLGGYHPQIPVLSVLNWICWTPPPKKKSWVRHWPRVGISKRDKIFWNHVHHEFYRSFRVQLVRNDKTLHIRDRIGPCLPAKNTVESYSVWHYRQNYSQSQVPKNKPWPTTQGEGICFRHKRRLRKMYVAFKARISISWLCTTTTTRTWFTGIVALFPTDKHECHFAGQFTLHVKAEGKISVAKHRILGAKEKFHAFDFELMDYKQASDGSTSATTLRDYW